MSKLICALACAALLVAAFQNPTALQDVDWPAYGHDPGGQRYSSVSEIDRTNVRALKVAWTYRTGDTYRPKNGRPTAFEATPIYVDGTLYLSTPLGQAIALDAVTGLERWHYRAQFNKDAGYGDFASRGVSTWKPAQGHRRIFLVTVDAHLIALDAATGKPCGDFGDNGIVNLRNDLRIPPHWEYSEYEETSPVAVVGDTVVAGSAIADNGGTNVASGEVRGFDAVTGKLKWTWHSIPQREGETGADTWQPGSAARTGAANAWSVIAVDAGRNLVFIPTGSASPDYYGGERKGSNLFANSLIALRGDTGERVWHFQTVHHDLWDYDVASPPLLFDIHRNGQTIPAIAVGSKTANLFILNRENGEPVFGVEERPVPKSDVPGEMSSPTQPFPVKPAAVSPQRVTAEDAWGIDEADRTWCRNEMQKLRADGVFTPPSLQGSLIGPGNIGGMAWGGAAYDNAHDLLILPANRIAAEVRLIPRAHFDEEETKGRKLNGGWEFAPQRNTPYGMMRRFILSPKGFPCTAPPWGTLLAIKGATGEKVWEVPLGHFRNVTAGPPLASIAGSISLGGPIVTAGGLAFMAGTPEGAVYAFDVETGNQLWEAKLPTGARTTPMTYRGPNGKQYVVVAAGGFDIPGSPPLGDYLVAFSL
jgi:quinoprotein glucose dehydrogenase